MDYEPERDDEDLDGAPIVYVTEEPVAGPALRWTPLTVAIDLMGATSEVLEAVSGFFSRQAESLAGKASLQEELEDRQIRQQFQEEARLRMRLHTLEDIAGLPGTGE